MADASLAPERRYWPRLMALSLVMLLPSLGTSIANLALPTLANAFNATMAGVQWVVLSYLLSLTSLIVGAGRLGDIVGRSRLLLVGIAIFTAASALGAVAPSLPMLIAARALQGVGAAIMTSLAVAMVGDLVPKQRTGSAMGLLGTVSAVGTAIGPSLGGTLLAGFGWPAVFVALAVLGGVALLVGRSLLLNNARASGKLSGFDYMGMILLALSLLVFATTMTSGGELPGQVLATLTALSALGFLAFAAREVRTPAPLVKLSLLRDPRLSTALTSLAFVSAIVMATLVVGPFYLAGTLGLGAIEVGLVMSIGPGVAALTGAPAGRIVDRLGAFRATVAGLLVVLIGSASMAVLPGLSDVSGYVLSLVLITFGYALFQAATTTGVMQRATSDSWGVTSALLGLSRNLGLIVGASAMGALYAAGPRITLAIGTHNGSIDGLFVTFVAASALAGLAFILIFVAGISQVLQPQAKVG